MIPGTRVSSDCKPDPGIALQGGSIPEHEIAKLADLSGGKMLSICSKNYGSELAKFGEEIKRATLQNKHVKLSAPPDMNTEKLPEKSQFALKFEGQRLTRGSLAVDRTTGAESIKNGDWA